LRKGEYPLQMKTRPVYHIHRFDPAWGFITEARIVATLPAKSETEGDPSPPRQT